MTGAANGNLLLEGLAADDLRSFDLQVEEHEIRAVLLEDGDAPKMIIFAPRLRVLRASP